MHNLSFSNFKTNLNCNKNQAKLIDNTLNLIVLWNCHERAAHNNFIKNTYLVVFFYVNFMSLFQKPDIHKSINLNCYTILTKFVLLEKSIFLGLVHWLYLFGKHGMNMQLAIPIPMLSKCPCVCLFVRVFTFGGTI